MMAFSTVLHCLVAYRKDCLAMCARAMSSEMIKSESSFQLVCAGTTVLEGKRCNLRLPFRHFARVPAQKAW